jgi:hypothetical protein
VRAARLQTLPLPQPQHHRLLLLLLLHQLGVRRRC